MKFHLFLDYITSKMLTFSVSENQVIDLLNPSGYYMYHLL
jgi:hypothetical protein